MIKQKNIEHSHTNKWKFLATPLWASAILPLALALICAVVQLFLEYHSNLFLQSNFPASLRHSIKPVAIYMQIGSLIVFTINAFLVIWHIRNSYKRCREPLAAHYLLVVMSFSLFITLVILTGIPLFKIISAFTLLVQGKPLESYQVTLQNYIIVLLCLIGAYFIAIKARYQAWNGLTSKLQHQRVKENDQSTFLRDGAIYLINPQVATEFNQLAPEKDSSLADTIIEFDSWKDQAKKLIRMTNKAYEFEDETGWHESVDCWVGMNRKTEETVILCPRHNSSEFSLPSLISYITLLPGLERSRCEIIFLAKEQMACQRTNINGWNVRYETEDNLINELLDLTNYLNKINRQVSVDKLSDSNLTIQDVYVPSRIIVDESEGAIDLESYIVQWLNSPKHQQLILLGDYGQGKSTSALLLTYHLLQQSHSFNRIPILIELRGTSPSNNRDPLGLLGDWAARYDINPYLLLSLNDAGRLLLIFEGFDEMSLVGDAEMRFRNFSALWAFNSPRSKIIFTGRQNLFQGTDEMERAFGLDQTRLNHSLGKIINLSFFSVTQIESALRCYPQEVREQITFLAGSDHSFNELVSRPSLLHVVASLWTEFDLFQKAKELDSAYVMDLFVHKSYRRPGVRQSADTEPVILTSLERAYFMQGVATYMAANNLPNQISRSQLDLTIEKLIEVIPVSVSEGSSAASRETRKPLKQRIGGIPYGVADVKTDVRTCGLLVSDPASPGSFKFAHKMFMEYLLATTSADSCVNNNTYRIHQAEAILSVFNCGISLILEPNLGACLKFFAQTLAKSAIQAAGFAIEKSHGRDKHDILAAVLLPAIINRSRRLTFIDRICMALGIIFIRPGIYFKLLIVSLFVCLILMAPSLFGLRYFVDSFLSSFMPILQRVKNTDPNPKAPLYRPFSFVFFLVMFITLYMSLLFSIFFKRQIMLWYHVCVSLDLGSESMYRAAKSVSFPILSRTAFSRFLAVCRKSNQRQ